MSGRRTGRKPNTDQELIRDIIQGQNDEAKKSTQRIGSWVLSEVDGEIVATKPGRPPVVLTIPVELSTDTSEVTMQRVVTLVGNPTGGTWTLIYRGDPTTALDDAVSAAALRAAIIALRTEYTTLNVDVSGPNGGPFVVTLPQGTLDADGSALTGGTTTDISITPA